MYCVSCQLARDRVGRFECRISAIGFFARLRRDLYKFEPAEIGPVPRVCTWNRRSGAPYFQITGPEHGGGELERERCLGRGNSFLLTGCVARRRATGDGRRRNRKQSGPEHCDGSA